MHIRNVETKDVNAIANLYNYYVQHTAVTFEEELVSPASMQKRINAIVEQDFPWLVLEKEGELLGYTYASKFKERSAYRFSAESTVYVAPNQVSKGLGYLLYTSLFRRLRELEINAVIGIVTLPNHASAALHEKMGMKKVGHFEKVGFKFNQWLDVGYWQLNLKTQQ